MVFIILGVFGLICGLVAHGKGRSPIGWFFIGFIAPLLGIILVFVLPDLKEAERRFNRLGKQNRLLRELLRQSRMATRKRLAGVNRRLSVHDRVLDMETNNDDQQEPLPYEDDGYADRREEVQTRIPVMPKAVPVAQHGTARVERPVAAPVTVRQQAPAVAAPLTTRTVQRTTTTARPPQAKPPPPRPSR